MQNNSVTLIESLRQLRLGKYAVFDFAAAFIGVYLLSPWLSKIFLKIKISIPRHSWLFLTLPISILAHLLSGNMTPMTQDFLSANNHYVLKILVLTLLVLGIKDIKTT